MKLKIASGISVFVLLLLSSVTVFAQGGLPCLLPDGTEDPDGGCPLDTWVVILIAVASVFAVKQLYHRQKALTQKAR
jgi:hypothetical protein